MTDLTNRTTLLILGNDKISKRAYSRLQDNNTIVIAIDKSTNIGRIIRLIKRGSLSVGLVVRMMLCEVRREKYCGNIDGDSIACNSDVIGLIERHKPQRIILFRAGLIISKRVISIGIPLLNIHCAKLPEYGGIGTISRALKDGSYQQCATLHQVVEDIDGGVVLDTEPYQLNPAIGYCANENNAYEAGIKLLLRTLSL